MKTFIINTLLTILLMIVVLILLELFTTINAPHGVIFMFGLAFTMRGLIECFIYLKKK